MTFVNVDGNLRTWILDAKRKTPEDYISMMAQISLATYGNERSRIEEIPLDNVLFYKTPDFTGQWMKYDIGDNIIYVKNTGTLWTLWDKDRVGMYVTTTAPESVLLNFPIWARQESVQIPAIIQTLAVHCRTATKESSSWGSFFEVLEDKVSLQMAELIKTIVYIESKEAPVSDTQV